MPTQFQVRNDTAANWTSANPTLLAGEIGYENNTNAMKIGDGVTAWNSLPYSPSSAGYATMEVKTSGTSWTIPAGVRKWKVTLVGGGGQGGGTATTAGQVGGGGGSGGYVLGYFTFVAGQTAMTYSLGAAGSGAAAGAAGTTGGDTTVTYNGVTYTASGGVGGTANGAGGAGGAASGGTLNIAGGAGANGGTMAATSNYQGTGGNTPLGLGAGGQMPVTAAGNTGNAGSGYGAGGSGGRNGTGTTSRAGGAGTAGVLIIEY